FADRVPLRSSSLVHREGAIFRPLDNTKTPHRPVFLIGFMCSGKSRIGRELSKLMGRKHLDLDRMIEKRTGPLLPFFRDHGEAEFRSIESEILAEVLSMEEVIVSTGGGTPCTGENLARMKINGTVIWLDVPFAALLPRIVRAGGDRPLLFGLKGKALEDRVKTLLEEREPIYAQAQLIVQASDRPDRVAANIKKVLDLQDR